MLRNSRKVSGRIRWPGAESQDSLPTPTAGQLLALRPTAPTDFEALWLEEAEQRLEEGGVEGIPGDEVMKEFRDLLA
jgi:hypothetical protein